MRPASRPPDASPIVFHDLRQARAALRWAAARGAGIVLVSPAGAARYWGERHFRELAALAEAEEGVTVQGVTGRWVLDCADAAGRAVSALHGGVREIRFTGAAEAAARLDDIAAALGARVWRADPAPVDLLHCLDEAAVFDRLDRSAAIVTAPRIG